jgi:hypothetical protein
VLAHDRHGRSDHRLDVGRQAHPFLRHRPLRDVARRGRGQDAGATAFDSCPAGGIENHPQHGEGTPHQDREEHEVRRSEIIGDQHDRRRDRDRRAEDHDVDCPSGEHPLTVASRLWRSRHPQVPPGVIPGSLRIGCAVVDDAAVTPVLAFRHPWQCRPER